MTLVHVNHVYKATGMLGRYEWHPNFLNFCPIILSLASWAHKLSLYESISALGINNHILLNVSAHDLIL